MSNIQRHRLERNGAYLAEDHDGGWVLHSDHAAELAEWKQRAERAEAYVAGQDVRSDFRNAGEMRAALDAALADVSMRSREVFRESQLRRNIEEMMKEHAEYLRENRMLDDQARAATDAANILKGAE